MYLVMCNVSHSIDHVVLPTHTDREEWTEEYKQLATEISVEYIIRLLARHDLETKTAMAWVVILSKIFKFLYKTNK